MASLIYEICSIFLLIVLISSPNQSQAQQQQLLQYETYNWIEISNGSWPKPKKDSKNSDFYFFHGNGDDPLKAFKSDIIPDWSRLIKGVEFDLEYWVNKENNLFRSSLENILPLADDHKLDKGEWENAHFHDISGQAWNRYKYLPGHDSYTVAFRNAKLAYMEKVPIINSYVEENEFLNIYENKKSQKLNQYKSVSGNIFYSYEKNIDFEVKLKNEKDKIKKIQLQLEYENHTTTLVEESYVMVNTLIDLNLKITDCSSNLDRTYFDVKCEEKLNNVHITITNKEKSTDLNPMYNPITISNVQTLDENGIEMDLSITSKHQVKPNQFFQSNHELYNPTDISFFRFIDKIEQTDVCYTINQPIYVNQMDVYFHLSPNEEPIYLDTFTFQPVKFCLNTYVALRNIPSFELIFVLNSKKLAKPFTVILERETETKFDVKIMDATSEILSSTWYYTNLNNKYAIENLQKDGVYACDILANCFPYEKTKNGHYELHDHYAQLLSQSPFFRIRGLSNDPKLTFEVDPISIQTKNLNEFLKHQFFIADMIDTNQPENHDTKYNLKLKKTKDYIIRIPLDVIDQRVYQLKVEIELNSNINLTHVTIDGSQNNLKQYLLSKPLNKNTSKMISFYTEDLFFVDKSQINPPTGKYIEIVFENLKEGVSLFLNVDLTKRTKIDANFNDNVLIKPQNFTLNESGKVKSLFILSETIRSPSKQALFPSEIEFDFNSNMSISKNDLSIIELVISQGTIQMFNVSSRLKIISDTSLQFKDEAIQTNPDLRRLAGDAYRLGYWITLNNDKLTDAANYVELKSFTINFTETNLDQIDIKPTVATDPELMFSRVCPLNFDCDYKDDQLKFIYKQKTVECDTQHQCNNIFEPLLYSSNYYLNDENIVRYSPTVRDSNVQSYLKVKRIISFNEKEDFCIQFDYKATKRPLIVSAHSPTESNELYSIEFATNELNKIGRKVCASWLAPDHTKIDAFYFQFLKADIDDITEHYVSNVKLLTTNTKPTDLDAIEFNERNIELFKNNFIDYEEIEFDKNNTILIKLNKLNENKFQTKFIRSKWIQGLKNGENSIHIQVSVEGQNAINSSFYTAKLIVSSPDKIEILTKNLPLSDEKSMNSIKLGQHVDWYQITIRLDYDFTLLKKHLDYFELKLSNIIVNDPCMEKKAKNKCENGGKCIRHYGNYSSTCDCGVMELYEGVKCELENFCKRPSPINGRTNENSYCKEMKCHSNQEIKMFECVCPNGNTWNYQRCLPNKLICGVNERPIINSDGADYGCQCMNGLVKIDGQCQTYDVCNSTHRMLLKQPPACHDKHAQCQTNGDDYSCHCSDRFFNQFGRIDADAECIPKECENCEFDCKSDWETNTWKCYCPAGYTFLDNENECIPNNEIIALAQKLKCPITNKSTPETPRPFIVDGNCRCTDGYKLDENKTCHIDLGYYTQKLNCGHLGAEIKQDDSRPGCKCLDGQRYDKKSRKCLNECDQKYIDACTARDAEKCQFIDGQAKCICSQDKQMFTFKDPKDWTCKPKCELLDSNNSCNKDYEHCDSNKDFIFKNLTNSVFVNGSSSVIPEKSNYCQCDRGFEKHEPNESCKPKGTPIINAEIDFELNTFESNQPNFKKKIEVGFKSLLKNVLLLKEQDFVQTETIECSITTTDTIRCKAFFYSEVHEKTIEKRLNHGCLQFESSSDTTKCVYLTRKLPWIDVGSESIYLVDSSNDQHSSTEWFNDYLTRVVSKPVKVTKDKFCDRNVCKKYSNSNCKDVTKKVGEKDFTAFECKCNETFFTVGKQDENIILNFKGQSCIPIDLCKKYEKEHNEAYCLDKTATCQTLVGPSNNSPYIYEGNTFCKCFENSPKLYGQNVTCSVEELCLNYSCQNNGTCHVENNKPVCHCPNGYSGDRCEHKDEVTTHSGDEHSTNSNNDSTKKPDDKDHEKKDDDDDSPNGFMIATIVLGIIAAIAIIAAAVLYCRRK